LENFCNGSTFEALNNHPQRRWIFKLYSIPKNTTQIGNGAFYNCTGLIEISNANPTPQIVDYYTFDLVNKSTCKLTLPTGSKTLYQNALYWQDFTTLSETTFELYAPVNYPDKITFIKVKNQIIINGTKWGDDINVYDLNGYNILHSKTAENSTILKLPVNGIYIIKISNFVTKVII
jgi:hypothetical protein